MTGPSIITQTTALLVMGRQSEAVELIRHAAAADDADALFVLFTWLLGGGPLPRDLAKARAVLHKCVEVGHVDGALIEIALTANGTGGLQDWATALVLLKAAALKDPVAAEQLSFLSEMALRPDGSPTITYTSEILSDSPKLVRFPKLFTPPECRYLTMVSRELLEPAVVVNPVTGKKMAHPIRTSYGAVLDATREDLIVGALNRRIASVSGTHFLQGEPLSILAYAPGQEYRPHYDALPQTTNQRIITVLVYLNDGYEGGQTEFLQSGIKVSPRIGDAIMFYNTTLDGKIDTQSQHAGLPVTKGTKWLATRWIRAQPYDPWNPS